ncbi:CatB-related O-acetyltransferase [Polaribacter irgensii]|nr:CatB-related O-acetyltransferase [Polaribacter irgensii]
MILIDNISIIKSHSKIYSYCQIFNSKIGSFTYISRKCAIVHADIGSYCSIANNVKIGMGQHKIKSISTSPLFYSKNNALGATFSDKNQFNEYQRVYIGSDVWVGAGAMIMSGVTVGHGAIIGAGAIVTKDVPNYAISAGVPAKIIRYRFNEKEVKHLVDSEWWNWSESIIKNKIHLFENNEFSEEMMSVFTEK